MDTLLARRRLSQRAFRMNARRRNRCTAVGCKRAAPKGYRRCLRCRANINRFLRARVALRKQLGLCRCGRRRAYKHKACAKCREFHNRYNAARKKRRRLAKRCTECGKPELATRTLSSGEVRQLKVCRDCATKRRDAQRIKWNRSTPAQRKRRSRLRAKRIRDRRAQGLCAQCGEPAYRDPTTGKLRKLCREHLDALNARVSKWTAEQRALGNCTKCGEPALPGRTRCAEHP